MKPLTIADAASAAAALQHEIQRSEASRYDHRLHAVLLVARGFTCPEVARHLGDAPRTVEYWVRRFEQKGLAGLKEGQRPGRPSRLNAEQMREIGGVLRVNLWDGKTLSAWIESQYNIKVGVRQCQRLFLHFDFRLRQAQAGLTEAVTAQQQARQTARSADSPA